MLWKALFPNFLLFLIMKTSYAFCKDALAFADQAGHSFLLSQVGTWGRNVVRSHNVEPAWSPADISSSPVRSPPHPPRQPLL